MDTDTPPPVAPKTLRQRVFGMVKTVLPIVFGVGFWIVVIALLGSQQNSPEWQARERDRIAGFAEAALNEVFPGTFVRFETSRVDIDDEELVCGRAFTTAGGVLGPSDLGLRFYVTVSEGSGVLADDIRALFVGVGVDEAPDGIPEIFSGVTREFSYAGVVGSARMELNPGFANVMSETCGEPAPPICPQGLTAADLRTALAAREQRIQAEGATPVEAERSLYACLRDSPYTTPAQRAGGQSWLDALDRPPLPPPPILHLRSSQFGLGEALGLGPGPSRFGEAVDEAWPQVVENPVPEATAEDEASATAATDAPPATE